MLGDHDTSVVAFQSLDDLRQAVLGVCKGDVSARDIARSIARTGRSSAYYRATMPERDGYIPGVPSWVEVSVPEPAALLPFYSGLFG